MLNDAKESEATNTPNDRFIRGSALGGATLFLLSDLGIGGSERKIVRIANELHRRGRFVRVVYLNGPDTLLAELDPGISVTCLERVGKFSLTACLRLRSYIRQYNISRLICVNLYPLLYAIPARAMAWRQELSCVALVNTTDFLNAKEKREMYLYSRLLRRLDRIVFGCAFQMAQWVEQYRLPQEICGYIYNGVDENYFSSAALELSRGQIRASMGVTDGDWVLGMVGQLRPEKQQRHLVEAVSILRKGGKPVKAIIVGEGRERAHLEQLVADNGLEESIKFLGEMEDVRPALLAMDIFVLTSVAVETFSNATLEAMSMGLPAIISDIAGAREMVSNGVNGYLYPKGDVEALSGLLNDLLEEANKMKAMGERARNIVVEKFSFPQMVDEYETLF